MTTTLHKRRGDMPRKPLEKCHGGQGALDWTNVLAGDDLQGKRLKFIHDDVLSPGVSIGLHQHHDDEEYYIILEGSGVMTLDDRRVEVNAGDVTAVFPGGRHALENTGDQPMRILVVCLHAQTPTA